MTRRPRLKPEGATSRELAFVINQILLGQINSVGEVTLTASQSSTTITRPYIGPDSVVLLMPKTANAAAEQSNIWITCACGAATIQHSNNSQIDRIFNFATVGG